MLSEEFCFEDSSFEYFLFSNISTCSIDEIPVLEEFTQDETISIDDLDTKNSEGSLLCDYSFLSYYYESTSESLKSVVDSHENNALLRDYVESKLWYDVGSNIFSAFYYLFISYTSPMHSSVLLAFQILDYYKAFEGFCSEEHKLLGYSICDIVEEMLYSNVLYYSGEAVSKIRKEHFSYISTIFKNTERVLRKTDLSSKRMKKEFVSLSDLGDYVPNISFVFFSEVSDAALDGVIGALLPNSLQKISKLFISKSVGQLSKELTKNYFYGDSIDSEDISKKVFMLTTCGTILPDFKRDFTQNHLYGHCLENSAYIFSEVQRGIKADNIV